MIWLYWRRARLVIGIAGLALGTLAALALVANALAGERPGRSAPAAVGRAGQPAPGSSVPSAGDPAVQRGMLLMNAAVAACQRVSYRGVQIVAWSSPGGSSSYLLDVWHRPGGPELAHSDDDSDDQIPAANLPGSVAGGTVGVLSISPGMLDLLRVNYVIEYAGAGSSSDRPAQIVALRRHDGTLAARYWLDQATGLPLRREMFDQSGHRVSEGAFIDLQIGDQDVGLMPTVEGRDWSNYLPVSRPGTTGPSAARLAALHADGWPVPSRLAGNMILARVTKTATPSGPVLDASYSDGLSVISVFMQRGVLPKALPGWHQADVDGDRVLLTRSGGLGGQGLAWSARGLVYTIIADAPSAAVATVVTELPHDGSTGFWPRVVSGLQRMASWFDPFG
jgi:sigma-E factor negative regulatory protein RseB